MNYAALWKALITELTKLASKWMISKLGTGYTWLVNLILKYGGQALLDLVKPIWVKIQKYFPQKKALEELEKVDQKPNVTPDELGKAYEDAINAGRK